MATYIKHLEDQYNNKTFKRKMDYIDYNIGKFIKERRNNTVKILEVGPGMGESIKYFNNLNINDIDVIDNDRNILNNIKNNYLVSNVFLSDNVSNIKNKIKYYDLIVMIQVLEHIPIINQVETVKLLVSRLKVGGRLYMVVPNANNPLGIVERYGDYQHTTAFTEQSLKDLVHRVGAKNLSYEIKGFEIPPYTITNIIRIVFQKLLHLFLLLLMIVNGGVHFKIMTPNIALCITKDKSENTSRPFVK